MPGEAEDLLSPHPEVLRDRTTAESNLPDGSAPQPEILSCGCELRGVSCLLTQGDSATKAHKTPGDVVKRLSKALTNLIVLAIAIPYFLLDAMFATVAIPLSRWIAGHWAFARIHHWILSLRPYPTLLLFTVPVIVLEPVKPVALYLIGTGHAKLGLSALVIAEILKLVLIERLFCVSRDKLLSIPAFAWACGKYCAVKSWLMSFETWQIVLRWSRTARATAQRFALETRRPGAGGDERDQRDWLPIRATARRAHRRM
jgi:hypothetical protein